MLKREAVYLWYYFTLQFEQIFNYWILGMAIGSFISVFCKDKINYLFSYIKDKRLGLLGIIPACILGIASPLCMYGTIPVAASFYQKGMREDWLAAFMTASILLNPQLIIYSAALGRTALIVRIASCFCCGVCAGLLIYIYYNKYKKSFFNFSGFDESIANRDTHPNLLIRYLQNFYRNVKATGLWSFIYALRAGGELCKIIRAQELLWSFDGGDYRRAVIRVRRRHYPVIAAMASGRHEHGQRSSIYDHRPGD